jgi:hypothetical protein
MTRLRKTALLWSLAGVASLVAGLMAEPRRPFAVASGLLFFVVAIVTFLRGGRPVARR